MVMKQNSSLNLQMGMMALKDEFFQNTQLPHLDSPNPSKDFIEQFSVINNEFTADKWGGFESVLKNSFPLAKISSISKNPKTALRNLIIK